MPACQRGSEEACVHRAQREGIVGAGVGVVGSSRPLEGLQAFSLGRTRLLSM